MRFQRTPKFHCTYFFVHKMQGRQHLIVDARDDNQHFKRPPSMARASPEALAGLECNAGSRFCISTVDVRDAFHRMALPDDLSGCFALLVGTARELNIRELHGKPLNSDEYLWPCCQCLPSWAVHLAQQATTAALVETIGITESELLHDRQLTLSLELRLF